MHRLGLRVCAPAAGRCLARLRRSGGALTRHLVGGHMLVIVGALAPARGPKHESVLRVRTARGGGPGAGSQAQVRPKHKHRRTTITPRRALRVPLALRPWAGAPPLRGGPACCAQSHGPNTSRGLGPPLPQGRISSRGPPTLRPVLRKRTQGGAPARRGSAGPRRTGGGHTAWGGTVRQHPGGWHDRGRRTGCVPHRGCLLGGGRGAGVAGRARPGR